MALFRSLGARPDAVVEDPAPPVVVSGRGTVAAEVRKAIGGLFTGPGVLPGSSSPLVQGTSGFAYQVNAGVWATPGGSGGGLHLWGNDGPMDVPTDPAPASGLSRIDIVYAVHPSASENGDTDSEPVVAVAKGTPASAPVAPSLPPRAIELGRNTMTSAATNTSGDGNTIAQSAPQARLVGTARVLGRHSRFRTANQGIPDEEATLVGSWNGSAFRDDPEGDWSATSGTSATAQFDGMARVRADVTFATNNVGVRLVQINRNGQTLKVARRPAVSGYATDVSAEWEGGVQPGDTFEVLVWQNSGGQLPLQAAANGIGFLVERTA